MIICSCNVLSDQEVRTAMVAEPRPRTTGELYRRLGCNARCGRCVRSIEQIMEEPPGAERRDPHGGHSVSRRSGKAGHHRHKI
jgi:bacterioferritin-associated ferredoxin